VDSPALLRLISEATRQGILRELRAGEKPVGDLVALLQDEQSNVSHHLSVLRDAGLVASRREGRRILYRLADAEVGRLLAQVEALANRLDTVAYTSSLGLQTDPQFHGYG
jgi:DNA-binding transcriptional ArsR family regulator